MENTLENKAKFFANYWDQNIMYEVGKPNSYFKVNGVNICGIDECYIQLKPLSQITDEDAVKLAELLGWELHDEEQKKEASYKFINGNEDSRSIDGFIEVVDFLRSKSYYLGNGLEIQYGWVKLKTY